MKCCTMYPITVMWEHKAVKLFQQVKYKILYANYINVYNILQPIACHLFLV